MVEADDGLIGRVVSIDRDQTPRPFWMIKGSPPVTWITIEFEDGVRKTYGSQRVKPILRRPA